MLVFPYNVCVWNTKGAYHWIYIRRAAETYTDKTLRCLSFYWRKYLNNWCVRLLPDTRATQQTTWPIGLLNGYIGSQSAIHREFKPQQIVNARMHFAHNCTLLCAFAITSRRGRARAYWPVARELQIDITAWTECSLKCRRTILMAEFVVFKAICVIYSTILVLVWYVLGLVGATYAIRYLFGWLTLFWTSFY